MMNINFKIICIMLLIILIASCASTQKAPDKMYYRIGAPSESSQLSVSINRPTAMGILGNRPMVAQLSNGALTQMQHNLWLESPKILLFNYLEETFASSSTAANDTLFLNSKILHFEKNQNTAVVSIQFTLIDHDNKTLYKHTHTKNRTLSENSIPAFVSAIKSLINEMLTELINDLP